MNYQMRLRELLGYIGVDSTSTRVVTGISLNSRQLKAGDLFISTATNPAFRAQHIEQAVAAGIEALCFSADLLIEQGLADRLKAANIETIAVPHLKEKVSTLAAAFYQHPSATMTVYAVTVTNGKTSVTQFITQALEQAGHPCGIIGTMGSGRLAALKYNGMTTPDPVSLQAILAELRDAGVQHVAIEASSHALQQGRLDEVAIDYAVLTNLSRDHLDYHQTMDAYADAKRQLFCFKTLKAAVLNRDDDFGQDLAGFMAQRQLRTIEYSRMDTTVAISAGDITTTNEGLQFQLHMHGEFFPVQTRLLGKFNVENMLATAAVLSLIGWSAKEIALSLNRLLSVSGRMQMLATTLRPSVVIDFAHTPDALAKALQGMRQHMSESASLWCVFGCGGDRDIGKRPIMGKIASQHADWVVLTNDNPRSENSQDILEQILAGCETDEHIYVEADRQQAIEYAITVSLDEDMVLIAGKGHENYQEISGVKMPFNDYEIAMQSLVKRHSATQVKL